MSPLSPCQTDISVSLLFICGRVLQLILDDPAKFSNDHLWKSTIQDINLWPLQQSFSNQE